ncbi:unnamed protein product [Rotaria sp. Silwood2]|nr:unnamed protein product [Rotaria sp. Silwood2]CAF3930410.1 unnamed protein product [Rotaria sp. Silwood2]
MPHQLQRLPLLDFLAIDSPELLAIITTTAATTVTITNNACTSSWRGITILQHEINIPDMSPYVQYTYTYVAIATTTRITFAIQEDNGFVALDDISVQDTAAPSVEILLNGGFEMNSLAYWLYCNPGGATQAGMVTQNSDYYPYYSYTYIAHSGNCFYLDGAVGAADYLSQTFSTVIAHTYTISYWLDNEGSGSSSSIDVLLSI